MSYKYSSAGISSDEAFFLQKIRLHNATQREMEGLHMVRYGLAPVREEEIKEILESRKLAKQSEKMTQIEEDLRRRQPEYYPTLIEEHTDDQSCQHSFQDAVPLADVDGRAVIFSPLKALFRIALIRCRVQERLNKIMESATGEKKVEVSAQGHAVKDLFTVAKLPKCSIEEDDLSLPSGYGPIPNGHDRKMYGLFYNPDCFEKHEFRVPFRFKTKNYSPVHFPEFSLDLQAEAAKEVGMFHLDTKVVSDIPTFRRFKQPVVTLERFPMPRHAYHFRPVSRYGEFEKRVNAHIAPRSSAMAFKNVRDPLTDGILTSALQVSSSMSSIPLKLQTGASEDSLSDSESDDGVLDRGYKPDLGWIPNPSHTINTKGSNIMLKVQRNTNLSSNAAFSHFLEKYS